MNKKTSFKAISETKFFCVRDNPKSICARKVGHVWIHTEWSKKGPHVYLPKSNIFHNEAYLLDGFLYYRRVNKRNGSFAVEYSYWRVKVLERPCFEFDFNYGIPND